MKRFLVAVCGPTGSGKSCLALHLAHRFRGEVIGCDSLQVYRHFDIGTAKLPEHEREGIQHHLIDVIDGTEGYTAGDYAAQARVIAAQISARGHLPIVAGGTGFYLRALFEGLPQSPEADGELRARLKRREEARPGVLHRLLRRIDFYQSVRIHPHDVAKVIRAIEIRALSKKPSAEQPHGEALTGFAVLKLGVFPERKELYSRLDSRCEEMFPSLLGEIASLVKAGVPRESKPFGSLGYKEGLAVLEGRLSEAEALERMKRDTRRYAKRQFTWFRRERELTVLSGFGDEGSVQERAGNFVQALLDSN